MAFSARRWRWRSLTSRVLTAASLAVLVLRADDTLLAFTDGLVEARKVDGNQLGVGRVVEIARAADLADPVALLDTLAEAGNAFLRGARAQDDRTVVCCHRRRVTTDAPAVSPV
jgi:serine phosphatase RsbU (regulator of sigma subunit)